MTNNAANNSRETWKSGWRIRASAWSTPAEINQEFVLRTLAKPGDLAPDLVPPHWSIHLGLLESLGTPTVRFLANGFELYFGHLTEPVRVVYIFASPGLLIGQVNAELRPNLFSPEHAVEENDQEFQIRTDAGIVFLRSETEHGTTRFCLCMQASTEAEARTLASSGLATNIEDGWQLEMDLRSRFLATLDGLDFDAALISHALEILAYHLESSPSNSASRTSAMFATRNRRFHLNHLFPLVQAWSLIDGSVATDLLCSAVDRIEPNGSVSVTPEQNQVDLEAPWPVLIRSCQLVWKTTKDTALLLELLPALYSYLEWAIERFEANGTGLPCWESAEESFIPDTFDENLASVSLASLLINETQALTELAKEAPSLSLDLKKLITATERIEQSLISTLWNTKDGFFHDQYVGGAPVSRCTLSGMIPLSWFGLPDSMRTLLLKKATDPAFFKGSDGAPLWQEWEDDPAPPPVSAVHQIYLLDALNRSNADAGWLERRVTESLSRHLEASGALPFDLRKGSAEPEDHFHPRWYESRILPACLALLTAPAAARKQGQLSSSTFLRTLDRNRFTVISSFIGTIAMLVFVVCLVSLRREPENKSPPSSLLLIENLMSRGDFATSRIAIQELKRSTPPEKIQFIEANLLFREGRYEEARDLYRLNIDNEIIPEKSAMNLALTFYKEGRLQEALEQYQQVIDRSDSHNKPLVRLAKTAVRIIQNYGNSVVLPESSRHGSITALPDIEDEK